MRQKISLCFGKFFNQYCWRFSCLFLPILLSSPILSWHLPGFMTLEKMDVLSFPCSQCSASCRCPTFAWGTNTWSSTLNHCIMFFKEWCFPNQTLLIFVTIQMLISLLSYLLAWQLHSMCCFQFYYNLALALKISHLDFYMEVF